MRAWGTAAFFIAGLGGLTWACQRLLGPAAMLPPWPALAGAALLMAGAALMAALAWVRLLRPTDRPRILVAGFMAAQLGKYIPGGIWLPAGQVGFAGGAGISVRRAVAALVTFAVTLAAAGGVVAAAFAVMAWGMGEPMLAWVPLLLLGPALPMAALLRGGPAVRSPPATWPAVRRRARMPPRSRRRSTGAPARCINRSATTIRAILSMPRPAGMLVTFGCLLATVSLMAIAFALLLRSLGGGGSIPSTMYIFAIAWLAGFVALGVPSGIGVREAVLVGMLADGAGAVLAASLAQRAVQMVVDIGLVAGTRDWKGAVYTVAGWCRARAVLLPNAVSALRLALVPGLWVMALRGEPQWVGVGLVIAGVSDIVDGQLARRLHVTSRLGAQLDSAGDHLIALSGGAWLLMLRPDVIAAFLAPVYVLLALYLGFLVIGWVKFRRFGNLHLYSAKVSAVLLYAFVVHCLLFPGVPATFFHVMWVVSTLSVLEALAYQLVSTTVDENAGSLFRVLLGHQSRSPGAAARRREPLA